MHIKITNPETTHQFVFLCAVCIRAHARRAYAHFTAHYIQRTPRAQACTPHTGAWVSSFKGAAKLQVLCEICKYTRRKAASLFSYRTRQFCIIRKFLVIIAKPLNYVIMKIYLLFRSSRGGKELLAIFRDKQIAINSAASARRWYYRGTTFRVYEWEEGRVIVWDKMKCVYETKCI